MHEEKLKKRRPCMEDGCLELTSSSGCNIWGTQRHDVAFAAAERPPVPRPRSVPAGKSFWPLQHLLLSACSLEPRAAPVLPPPLPMPQSLEGRAAPCVAQRGREQPRGWGGDSLQAPPPCQQHRPRDQPTSQEHSRAASCPSLPKDSLGTIQPSLALPGGTVGADPAVSIQPSCSPWALPSPSSAAKAGTGSPPVPPNTALPNNSHRRAGCRFPLIYHLSGGRVKKKK